MSKPTYNEIIKALECRILTGLRKINKCGKCKYVKSDACNIRGLITDALDLINRQNEQLKANFDSRQTNECENIDVARFEAEINRQQAEIERLKLLNASLTDSCEGYVKAVNKYRAENERLKNALTDHEYGNCVAVKNGLIYTHTLEDYDELIADISAETYKKFAERLKEKSWDVPYETKNAHFVQVVDVGDIDNLLKELVGDINEN